MKSIQLAMAAAIFAAMPLAAQDNTTAAVQDAPAEESAPSEAAETQAEAKPVAVFFMRQSVIPRDGDEMHLKQGMSVHIAAMSGGMTIVEYGLKDGQITWQATTGSVDAKTAKAIDKAVAKLQKKM